MSSNRLDQYKKPNRWYGRIPITPALVISIGILMVITVGSALGISIWTARKNTINLLGQSAYRVVTTVSNRLVTHLKPAEFQAKFIADWISRGEITPDDRPKFGNILIAALAAAPQIEAILYINSNLQSYGAGRLDGKTGISKFDYSADPHIISAMKRASTQPGWGPPIWRDKFKKTYLNYAYPVIIDGTLKGAIIAVVSIRELSQFVGQSGVARAGRSFLLYGQDHILAHWALENGYAGRSAERSEERRVGKECRSRWSPYH